MKGFNSNIERDTLENNNFRKVLYSGNHLQLVLMSLKAGEDSTTELKMYTIYVPPHHKDGIVRATKEDAENNEAEFDGKTTE